MYVTLLHGVIAGLQHPDAAAADRVRAGARVTVTAAAAAAAAAAALSFASIRREPPPPHDGRRRWRRRQHAQRRAGDVVPRRGGRCDLRPWSCGEAVIAGRRVGGGAGRHVAHRRRPTKAPRARRAAECREYHITVSRSHTVVVVVRLSPVVVVVVRQSVRSTVVWFRHIVIVNIHTHARQCLLPAAAADI